MVRKLNYDLKSWILFYFYFNISLYILKMVLCLILMQSVQGVNII